MTGQKPEIQKQKLENIGYISLVDFLAQNNIDVREIREVFDEATKGEVGTDIVGNFLSDQRIVDIFNNAPVQYDQIKDFGDVGLEEYGFETFEDLAMAVNKYESTHPGVRMSDPQIMRSFIDGYHQSHKELDILANKQHAGDRITATVSELVQNAIDATAQAKNPNITPIGKFGMGAKTMFGSMEVGDSLLLQSKDKTFFVIKTGQGVESLVCSDKKEFIQAQLAKRQMMLVELGDEVGTKATLSYAKKAIEDSVKEGVTKFKYNPNVNIELNNGGNNLNINALDDEDIRTDGQVRVNIDNSVGYNNISIEDQGNGFDPIKLFQTSTKNTAERYSHGFENDSSAHINKNESGDVVMLIQDTIVSIDTSKNKERYIESSLTKGIVIDNKSYLQTSESRSDWSVTEDTLKSLEFAFNNLIEDAPSKEEQAKIINTLYLWYESLPQAKKLALTPIKDQLITQTQDLKKDSNAQFLPNLKQFNQFKNDQTIYLHPDLIGTYSPENIEGARYINSKNGFAIWGVDMKIKSMKDTKLYEAIGKGESVEDNEQSKTLKLDNSIPPQIWVDKELLQSLDDLYNSEDEDAETKYNYKVWLLNSSLNPIDNSYKAVSEHFNYYDSFQTRKEQEQRQKEIDAHMSEREDIVGLNNQYRLQDKEYLLNVNAVLEGKRRVKEKNYNSRDFDYSLKENIDTGAYELKVGHEVMFTVNWGEMTFKIEHTRADASVTGKLPFNVGTPEYDQFYNSIMDLKNGQINYDESILSDIVYDVFDGRARSAYGKFSKLIETISDVENGKPKELKIDVIPIRGGGFEYMIPGSGSMLIIVPVGQDVVSVRYSKNGRELFLTLRMDYEDMMDLFDKELIMATINKNTIASLSTDISHSKFEMLAHDLIQDTLETKVKNGDNGNYKAVYGQNKIRVRNVEGCDFSLNIYGDNSLYLNFDSDKSELEIKGLKLGKIEIQDEDDPFNRLTRFIGRDGFLHINDVTLKAIKALKIDLDNIKEEYEIDELMEVKKDTLFQAFRNTYGESIDNNFVYKPDVRTNTKDDYYLILDNPTNEIRIDYSKSSGVVGIDFAYYDNEGNRKSISIATDFDGEFNINDTINLESQSFAIHQAMISSTLEQGEYAVTRILEEIIKQYGSGYTEGGKGEGEGQEVENKTELLNEFAQVGAKIEALKENLNYSYDSKLMTKGFNKEVKNIDDAKEWLATNQELISYLDANGSEFDSGTVLIAQELKSRIERMKQNNFFAEKLDEKTTDTSLINHHMNILKGTLHLSNTSKSSVMLSILSGEQTEFFDVSTFNNITVNFDNIQQGLGQASKAAIDSIQSTLLNKYDEDINVMLERIIIITNNIIKIKNEKPELYEYIINKLTNHSKDGLPLMESFCYDIETIADKEKALFRFLSTPNAVLLEDNQLEDIKFDPKLTITPDNLSLGEIGFLGRSVVHADQLQKNSIEDVQKNPKAQEFSAKINKEINRLATSQVSGDKWTTVLRELFQNSKDSANKMNKVSNIDFKQDLYTPEEGSWLDKSNSYLRTEFSDDATGIPEFLFNYFNPMKSTKDIGDSISAGAFGCGAITINSIADFYEIKTKNKDEKEGFHIKVEVIKSKDGTQVLGTKVIEVSSITDQESGTTIRMFTKNTESSTIPELQALISQGALVELSELEVLNNPNINLNVQGEKRESPANAKAVYKSDKVQFVEGVKPGYWVKNLFVSDLNHDQNQFSKPLPEFLSTMLKDNPVAINFQNKLDLVRTRTGFSQTGEQEALNILSQEYLKYIATEMFNGSLVNIPGLDNNLSQAYQKYNTLNNANIADELFNKGNLTLDRIGELSNSQWISMLLHAPVEVDGQTSNLTEMFKILDQVAQEVSSKNLKNKSEVKDNIQEAEDNLDPNTKALYQKLQKSKLTSNYGSLNITSAINLGLSQEQREDNETILNPEDLPPETLKTRQIFESIFNQLTKDLPITRMGDNSDHRMVYVSRSAGTDYSGQIKYDEDQKPYMLWKFDFKNIGLASTNSTMSPGTLSSMCEVIVHEIAHQLEKVGARKPGTHDEIFNELMKANFAKLLNNPK